MRTVSVHFFSVGNFSDDNVSNFLLFHFPCSVWGTPKLLQFCKKLWKKTMQHLKRRMFGISIFLRNMRDTSDRRTPRSLLSWIAQKILRPTNEIERGRKDCHSWGDFGIKISQKWFGIVTWESYWCRWETLWRNGSRRQTCLMELGSSLNLNDSFRLSPPLRTFKMSFLSTDTNRAIFQFYSAFL